MNVRRALLPLGVAACLAAAPGAGAQTGSAIPLQPAPHSTPAGAATSATALPWSKLDPAQQRMLAPLQTHWAGLEPGRQHRLARHARHWESLPDDRQDRIRQRLVRWFGMSPEERHRLRENERAYQHLPARERARIATAFRRFQSLPPEQRHALRERWHALQQQRRHRPADGQRVVPLQQPAPAAATSAD